MRVFPGNQNVSYVGNTCIIWLWCSHLNLMPSAGMGDSPVPQHKMPGELNRSENPRVRGDNLTRLIRSTWGLTNAPSLAFGQMHLDCCLPAHSDLFWEISFGNWCWWNHGWKIIFCIPLDLLDIEDLRKNIKGQRRSWRPNQRPEP